MSYPASLRILFATNFSDACRKTGDAIAQLGDQFGLHLTIAHVAKPGSINLNTRKELDSVLPEANRFDYCQRKLILSEDPTRELAALVAKNDFDLVMVPASRQARISRLFLPSFRANLMEKSQSPLWTAGSALDHIDIDDGIGTVACTVDFQRLDMSTLRLASSFALKIGAKLRILGVISPVTEGDLIHPEDNPSPLSPSVAMARLQKVLSGIRTPEVDVVIGERWWKIGRVLQKLRADLVFLGPSQALVNGWVPRLRSYVDRLPCPAICIDGASGEFAKWSFELSRSTTSAPLVEAETLRAAG